MDDLFGDVPQPERAQSEPRKQPLTAQDVREAMMDIIRALRTADDMPFTPAELSKHKAMFPIMAQWLTPEDGEQLVFQFEVELERLRAA